MKKALCILGYCILFSSAVLTAQTGYFIEYGYDDAGNRVNRKIIPLRTEDPSKSHQSEDALQKNNELQEYSEILANQNINIFPNPTDGDLTIEIKNFDPDVAGTIRLYNSDGKLVGESQSFKPYSHFDLNTQPMGVYFLHFQVGEEKSSWKIIKQ